MGEVHNLEVCVLLLSISYYDTSVEVINAGMAVSVFLQWLPWKFKYSVA
jgi:hypothetical protein